MAGWDRRYSRRQFIRGAAGVASGAVAVGSAGSLLAACGGSTPTAANQPTGGSSLKRDPETLVVAMDAFTPDFDPASYFLLAAIVPDFGIYDSLMRMKGNSATETKPWLAQKISTNANKSVWTFTLRSGVKYSDGTPFDGNALKEAYTRTISAQLGAGSTLSNYITDPAKQIVVKDPGTVVMDLGISVPRFDLLLASQYGTGIVNPDVKNQGSDQGHSYLQSHSAGTGAYMVQSVAPNSQIVMTANPHYWGGWSGSHFKKIIILQVPENSNRRQGMESGDFDIAFASTPQDTAALRKTPGIFVGNQKVLGMDYVFLADYGPLASPLARQAINLLFPIDSYVSSVMKGTIEKPTSVLPDLMLYAAPGTYTPTMNVAKAKSLLQQAGVKPGTQLTYEFYTGQGDAAGLLLQSQLSLVGLKVKIVEKAYPAFVDDISTFKPVAQRPDMAYWFWWPEYNNPSDFAFPILSKDGTPVQHLFNGGYYENAAVNNAINSGFTDPSNSKQLTQLWHQAQTAMGKEDPPWIPLGQIIDTSYLRTDVKGYVANPVYVESYDFYALSRASSSAG
jgi:peptide/nickel transport system substrate-binding protein